MSLSGQDIGAIFKYPLQDPQWFSKLILQGAILTFLSFLFIGLPFLMGFTLMITKRAIENNSTLPDWSDWGEYWRLGWRMIATQFLYMLPLLALWFLVVIFFVISTALVSYDDAFAVMMLPSTILFFVSYLVTFLYSLVLGWLMQPTYSALLAVGAPIKACFRFKDLVWPYIKANVGNIILGALLVYLAGMIASVGMFFLFVGYFFTFPYALAIMGYVHGLIYRQSPIQYKA